MATRVKSKPGHATKASACSFGAAARRAIGWGVIALVLLVSACTQSDGNQQGADADGDEVVPSAGELYVRNSTDDSICHVFVHPVTNPNQRFDFIDMRNENVIKPHSLRRFLQGNEPALNVQSPYKVEAESCSGTLSEDFEFSWQRGSVFTVSVW